MQYVEIIRNTEGVDSFKPKNENLVELDYNDFISKLNKELDGFNSDISKAKGILDSVMGMFGNNDFKTEKGKLSKEDSYLQDIALPEINAALEEYANEGKIKGDVLKLKLGQISKDFLKFMEGKKPKNNPITKYSSGETSRKKIDEALKKAGL